MLPRLSRGGHGKRPSVAPLTFRAHCIIFFASCWFGRETVGLPGQCTAESPCNAGDSLTRGLTPNQRHRAGAPRAPARERLPIHRKPFFFSQHVPFHPRTHAGFLHPQSPPWAIPPFPGRATVPTSENAYKIAVWFRDIQRTPHTGPDTPDRMRRRQL